MQHGRAPTVAQQALRVVEAVWAGHGDAPIGMLYTELGTRFIVEEDLTLGAIAAALAATGLDPSYLADAEEARWDDEIRWSMNQAVEVVGPDVPVPVLVFIENDRTVGISDPVLSEALWDQVVPPR
jgi:hypothetical protein